MRSGIRWGGRAGHICGLIEGSEVEHAGHHHQGTEGLKRTRRSRSSRAQALGFSLDEIRRIVDDARKGESPCDEVREIVRRRMAELDERLRDLHRYRKELSHTLEEWDKVGRAPGNICGLIEGSELEHAGHSRGAEGLKRTRRGRAQSG